MPISRPSSHMPLKKGMTVSEIAGYLQGDLKQSIVRDVQPCLGSLTSPEGLFAVPRLVLSYVDYLGALYHGYQPQKAGKRRKFADQSYAKMFLKDVFGTVDPNYAKHGHLLWEIYRNGTVHLYEPMKLRNQGRQITWEVYKGPRTRSITLAGPRGIQTHLAVHLVPWQYEPNKWAQPISINCLYEDLLAAMDEYVRAIQTNCQIEQRFSQTADALQTPEETSLQWW